MPGGRVRCRASDMRFVRRSSIHLMPTSSHLFPERRRMTQLATASLVQISNAPPTPSNKVPPGIGVTMDSAPIRSSRLAKAIKIRRMSPLADERIVSEAQLANLLGIHTQHARRQHRLDAEQGTPGHRLPPPVWVSTRRVGYRVRDICAWLDARPSSPPAV